MDYLRRNIRHLIGRRSVKQVGDESGVSQPWLARFLNPDKPDGIKKHNADKIAALAKYFGVTIGDLMFKDLSSPQPVAPPSQPEGRERQIVAAAVKLVEFIEELAPQPFPREQYAEMLYVAMQVVREESAEGVLDGSKLVDASRRFAARLRAAGGG